MGNLDRIAAMPDASSIGQWADAAPAEDGSLLAQGNERPLPGFVPTRAVISGLQRTAGNAGVASLLTRPVVGDDLRAPEGATGRTALGEPTGAPELRIVQCRETEKEEEVVATLPLQRQVGDGSANAWNGLDGDLRKVLQHSYDVLHSVGGAQFWIWNRARNRSASQCFDSLDAARQVALSDVHRALRDAGLWAFVDHVVEFWPSNTRGIRFMPADRGGLVATLAKGLSSSKGKGQFCIDWIGVSAANPKWRQITQAGSEALHLAVPSSGYCTAHLDRISPAKGRNKGLCDYAVLTGFRHWLEEEEHGRDKSGRPAARRGPARMTERPPKFW